MKFFLLNLLREKEKMTKFASRNQHFDTRS